MSAVDGKSDEFGFFVILTIVGVLCAILLLPVFGGGGRTAVKVLAALWVTCGVWIGVLLVMYRVACACSGPPPPPDATYLGLTATTYHLIAMYGSTALMIVAAFGRSTWLDRPVGRSRNLG